ncbi:marR family protein [Asticcacaulis biprosthecium C19]|uniref:MarR family protein n=1 Tax=Asticcacaulis biprosthecium C19 TaxID=715226 RepID=F4QNY5_9CAUL|nr:MarR family transcriptional regulator [Asticcacaulis biprosthecium]EGF91043.1 marR family protein [Asticcacaulis biprosthecium C19]
MKKKTSAAVDIDPAELLESQIGFQLRLAQLAVFGEIIDRMKEIGLRPVDLSVLMLIEAEPGLRQHVIGDRLKIQRPNVVALIDALEGRGLVERKVDKKDRRANQLALTKSGAALLAQAKAIQRQHLERMHRFLEGVDIDNFMKGLRQLAAMPVREADEA